MVAAGKIKGMPIPRPFLKWAGGKAQLLSKLLEKMPEEFNAYHEPFMGGAAMFFALYRQGLVKGRQVYLSDANKELVDTFKAVRSRINMLISKLRTHHYDKDYYYEVRSQDPDSMPLYEKAARMIFLNRTGFNGLYRVNSKGKFNVPFGRYKNPTICDEPNLRAVSRALKGVFISSGSFEKVLNRANPGDLVYFDPPYVPVSSTAYFTAYSSTGFGQQDQTRLAQVFSALSGRGVQVMLSNSDTPLVRKLYADFHIQRVLATRLVNSRSDRRGPVYEVIVRNFSRGGNE